jgi:hypothetical protein
VATSVTYGISTTGGDFDLTAVRIVPENAFTCTGTVKNETSGQFEEREFKGTVGIALDNIQVSFTCERNKNGHEIYEGATISIQTGQENVDLYFNRVPTLPELQEERAKELESRIERIEALELPVGTVAAFQLNECPAAAGWEFFGAGAGRTIIGAGQGDRLTNRNLSEIGGEERHLLTVPEMPRHQFFLPIDNNPGDAFGVVAAGQGGFTGDHARPTNVVGEDVPHENMQPWIALQFCQKK